MSTTEDIRLSNSERARSFLSSVSNPQDYYCSVLGYVRGLSQLYIKAETISPKTDRPVILGFASVKYFEGPMRWQGLDFRLGSVDEKITLLQQEWLDVGNLLNKFAEDHLLFVLERPKFRVQIFSGTFDAGEAEPKIHIAPSDLSQEDQF